MSLAILFPGQGSQSTGMLSELAASFPEVESVYSEASQVLGFDLWKLVQHDDGEALNKTENTQPALLAAGVATWKIWQAQGGQAPTVFAGHSLGEYTALVCAGALEYTEAVSLVADRGRYMQEAVPAGTGAMAAILGLEDSAVIEVCRQINGDQIVSAANFNSPGQVVIAGHTGAVQEALESARQAGAKRAVLLPVSVPSHCSLMLAAAQKLELRLDQVCFSDASVPVVQNVDSGMRTDMGAIKKALVEQLHQPVHWYESIEKMKTTKGITQVVECGPGKVLTGLCKRIDRGLGAAAVYDPASLHKAIGGEE